MSKYFVLDYEVENNDYFAEKVDLSDLEVQDLYLDGVSLKHKDFRIMLKKKSVKGRVLDVRNMIENLYSFPIVSQTIADVLLQYCPNEIELFEVKVNMPTQTKYYFVNILTLLTDCIDLEKSVYKLIMPERPDLLIFRYLERLILETEKINNHIFRIKSLMTRIIISEFLKNKIQELNLPEITFQPTEEYQSQMYSKRKDD